METPDYVLDPNGDVIITLRNFNAPFPILPLNNEELSTFEDFQLEGSTTTKKGSKKKAKTMPLGTQPEPEPSLEHTVAAGEPPAVEQLTASEVPVDSVDEVLPTEAESVERSVKLQASSAHLRLGSRYFEKALDGRFHESHSSSNGLQQIDAEGWDIEALLIVMQIVHGQNRHVPRSLDLEMLVKVAAIVDYYQFHEILEPFSEIWRLRTKDSWIADITSQNLIPLLFVSWVLGWPEEFKAVTKIAQTRSKRPLSPLGLPIPERIIRAIDDQRRETLGQISAVLNGLLDRFRKEPTDCSEACSSLQLGSLERRLRNQDELQFYTSTDQSLVGYSVASAMRATRELRSANWNGEYHGFGSSYHHCDYNLHSLAEKEVRALEALGGLDLNLFGPV
ncbi:hypothetical protein F5Y12DRAFT_779526 [Xylaria sp. FL1777]|nr:hypothetical protein F5Y12DRAFT_779526 [Xylaria sp. FL1777]